MQKTAEPFVRESKYTTAIAIRPDHLRWIKEVKSKKSAAGKLDEIIEFYKNHATTVVGYTKTEIPNQYKPTTLKTVYTAETSFGIKPTLKLDKQ